MEALLISTSAIALAMKLVPTIAAGIFALLGLATLSGIGAGFRLWPDGPIAQRPDHILAELALAVGKLVLIASGGVCAATAPGPAYETSGYRNRR